MRLSDLVHRSALRNRTAGDAEVSSFSPKVFEVTNLTIPAGTLAANPHVIGSLDFSPPLGALVFDLFLEIDDPGNDGMKLAVDGDEAYGGFSAVQVVQPKIWNASGAIVDVPSNGLDQTAPFANTPTLSLSVNLIPLNSPTTFDIHIVRARAAFLLV